MIRAFRRTGDSQRAALNRLSASCGIVFQLVGRILPVEA